MRLLAVGDVHGHQHLDELRDRLANPPEADLLLLAGDITHRNDLDVFGEVLDLLREAVDAPAFAVFGNHEWSPSQPAYRERFPSVVFLQDEVAEVEVDGTPVRIVGSTGVLDRPTGWQRSHVPGIWQTYTDRVEVLDRLLDTPETSVLLTHYAPTFRTLEGEGESYWDQLGSRRLEAVVLRRRPRVAIHGHAHRGAPYAELTTVQATLEDLEAGRPVPVHNVAFPVRKDVSRISVAPG